MTKSSVKKRLKDKYTYKDKWELYGNFDDLWEDVSKEIDKAVREKRQRIVETLEKNLSQFDDVSLKAVIEIIKKI